MKFVSWNVNGIRSCLAKGFKDFFKLVNADFFCLQEVKANPDQVEIDFDGYHRFWNNAERKGYSGTAIFTKHQPIKVSFGMNGKYLDEGRLITLEYENFYLVDIYSPNSKPELERLEYRQTFEDALREFLGELKQKKGVIVCGDLNVAHKEIDLKNPKSNLRSAGFTIEERTKFSSLLESGFIDSFRHLYPEVVKYTWWSYMFHSREKNIGWRIDYFLVSDNLQSKIRESTIYNEVLGSDHCPVGLVIDL